MTSQEDRNGHIAVLACEHCQNKELGEQGEHVAGCAAFVRCRDLGASARRRGHMRRPNGWTEQRTCPWCREQFTATLKMTKQRYCSLPKTCAAQAKAATNGTAPGLPPSDDETEGLEIAPETV